jgi:hypothetical protein
MRVPRWARITLISVLVTVALGVGAVWAFATFALGPGPMARCAGHERFQLAVWRDSAQVDGPLAVRGCIVDDLLATHDFHGRSRTDVVALLGEPPRTQYFKSYDLVYWLGPERGLISIDSEWLVFRLDSTHHVQDYRLVTD